MKFFNIVKTCSNPKPGHHLRLSSNPSECAAMAIWWNRKFKPSKSNWHASNPSADCTVHSRARGTPL